MPGIYVMAALTVALALGLGGGLLYALTGRTWRYLWLVPLALPLSAVVNLYLKRPLLLGVADLGGLEPGLGVSSPLWFLIFVLFVSPVTEEAIKVAPALVPRVRGLLSTPRSALWTGTALGLGFGLGEAAYIAHGVAQTPEYAGLPWHLFTGYMGERTIVCLVHAMLTGIVVAGMARGVRGALGGYLLAVLLHAVVNSGALAYQLDLIPNWAAQASLLAGTLPLAFLYERLRKETLDSATAWAEAQEQIYFRREP